MNEYNVKTNYAEWTLPTWPLINYFAAFPPHRHQVVPQPGVGQRSAALHRQNAVPCQHLVGMAHSTAGMSRRRWSGTRHFRFTLHHPPAPPAVANQVSRRRRCFDRPLKAPSRHRLFMARAACSVAVWSEFELTRLQINCDVPSTKFPFQIPFYPATSLERQAMPRGAQPRGPYRLIARLSEWIYSNKYFSAF